MLRIVPSTTTPVPGEVVSVAGSGCPPAVGPVVGVVLVHDATLLTSQFPITPADDGTFDTTVTVPSDIPPGSALVLRAMCGGGDIVLATVDVALTVASTETSTEPPAETPATAAPDVTTRPSFTG
jgi:hypothetical protein